MKVSFRVIAIASFFSILFVSACAKKGEDCKTCKALNGNGTVAREETVCTPEEEANFRRDNPDKEVVCN